MAKRPTLTQSAMRAAVALREATTASDGLEDAGAYAAEIDAATAGATAQQVFGAVTSINKAEALIAPACARGDTVGHTVLTAVLIEIRRARSIIA